MALRDGPPRRLAPRPLPLHLLNAIGLWASSRAGLPLSRSGSLLWRLDHAEAASALQKSLAAVAYKDIAAAVDRELRTRADAFITGIERYRSHPYRRVLADPPVLWQEGTTRLLDFGPAGAPPLLVVPSLINRSYILDLAPDTSLLRHLAASGIRPLLVDWDSPDAVERSFTLTDYIAGRLEAAATAAADIAGAPMGVMGYCMGGLLALALAERRPRLVRALAFLATPWSFHAERAEQARLVGALDMPCALAFGALGELPVDVLQALFSAVDPLVAMRKYTKFAVMDQKSAAAQRFVALEDWLNDGVPLALPVARECLGGWYGADTPGNGRWRIAGRAVLPSRVTHPSLVVVPGQDRIVPPAGARALAIALPAGECLTPPLGHIGMIVGHEARRLVWQPLTAWLRRHLATGSQTRRRGLSK
jgi:polyhydroxyalkanoate synthase subunit PhaC